MNGIGICIKLINQKTGKTAEFIVNEHLQVAERKGGYFWFSTSLHLSNRVKNLEQILLYFVGNNGQETVYRGNINYILNNKQPFVPGDSNDKSSPLYSPFNKDIKNHIIEYSPESYADVPACTWFFVNGLTQISLYDFEKLLLYTEQDRKLSEVINAKGRTSRAFYKIEPTQEDSI